MSHTEIVLVADCPATRIPSGEPVTLPAGKAFVITQALGGSVTLRGEGALFRVGEEAFDALGDEVKAAVLAKAGSSAAAAGEFSEELVWDALRQCFDPEIPINIVDLGLIYDLRVEPAGAAGGYEVHVKMTLTATGCGMGPTIAADAKSKIEALPDVKAADVQIVWDPQWNPNMISEEGRKVLGLD